MTPITRTTRICHQPAATTLVHQHRGQRLTTAHTCARHRAEDRSLWPGRYTRAEPGSVCGEAVDLRPYHEALGSHLVVWMALTIAIPRPLDLTDGADWGATDWPDLLRDAADYATPYGAEIAGHLDEVAALAARAAANPLAEADVLAGLASVERQLAQRRFDHGAR